MASLKNLFSGRLNRKSYLLGIFTVIVVSIINFFVFWAYYSGNSQNAYNAVFIFITIISIVFMFSLTARRLQDVELPGWWSIPIIIILFLLMGLYLTAPGLLILGITPGTKGSNKFGSVPGKKIRLL